MNDVLTYHTWNEKASEEVMDTFSGEMDVLKWAYSTYQKIVYACSFGAEGIVLIDLISKVVKEADIVFLDTGLHFPETYELINEVKDRYPGLSIRFLKPGLSLEEQEKTLWQRTLETPSGPLLPPSQNRAAQRASVRDGGMDDRAEAGAVGNTETCPLYQQRRQF